MSVLNEIYPYYLASRAEFANADLAVTDKYTGAVATRVALGGSAAIGAGIAAAVDAAGPMAAIRGILGARQPSANGMACDPRPTRSDGIGFAFLYCWRRRIDFASSRLS